MAVGGLSADIVPTYTVEWLGDRTFISFVNGGMETLETTPDEVIQPHQVSGHSPLM
jgi:hypothetical protein